MTTPALPQVTALAERYVEQITRSEPGQLWQIDGEDGAGKSSALRYIAAGLRGGGDRQPVVVAPPARALDSGPVGLIELASGLRGLMSQAQLDALLDPGQTWRSKLTSIRSILRDHNHVVLLCDSPRAWPATGHTHFALPTRELLDRVVFDSTGCTVVVAGNVPEGVDAAESERLEPASAPEVFLATEAWGPLTGAATSLWECFGDQPLSSLSPLKLRLLVAHLQVSSVEALRGWWNTDVPLQDIAHRLLDELHAVDPQLYDVWLCLARVRRPFSPDLADLLGATQLETTSRSLLDNCLLYGGENYLILHDVLRTAGLSKVPEAGEQTIHATLADYYAERFGQAVGERDLRDELEAFHHATRGGSLDWDRLRPFFVEQLNALGYYLSLEERRYSDAVTVYRRALEWDGTNDYAAHYVAFNLDIQAREMEDVEAHYERAVELNGSHPWWHASRVNFYVATGRTEQARRAWTDAQAQFETADAELTVNLCQDLHIRVARTLLYFGELDFAEAVLRGVPLGIRDQVSGYHTVRAQAEARRLARDHGNFVPGPLLRNGWWNEGPFLVKARQEERMTKWAAAEITDITDEVVVLNAAVIEGSTDGEAPSGGEIPFTISEFSECVDASLDEIGVGEFVEIGFFEDSSGASLTRIRMHPQREWEDATLPSLRPDPLRWLQSEAAS